MELLEVHDVVDEKGMRRRHVADRLVHVPVLLPIGHREGAFRERFDEIDQRGREGVF